MANICLLAHPECKDEPDDDAEPCYFGAPLAASALLGGNFPWPDKGVVIELFSMLDTPALSLFVGILEKFSEASDRGKYNVSVTDHESKAVIARAALPDLRSLLDKNELLLIPHRPSDSTAPSV